ncbi:DUF1697 domain-containing protein [Xanthovirga aplysinae]|uniref:DUF1697 domain-containing protein n=1 Tax=Xanthovirga aplysinae TaxID=2529853 RepID=UPI0012BBD20C|nr:DUF1697 domain-containing protein [Xanthovirga aplysinae]
MRYIALLRGINIGRYRKILMADLRKLFEDLGFSGVTTYIQTGNIVLNTSGKVSIDELANNIEQSLFSAYGFEVPVIVRTVEEINELIVNNPFLKNGKVEVERLHLTFLKDNPTIEKLEKVINIDSTPDKFEIVNKNIFIYCSKLYSDSKLGNTFFENTLKVKGTTRNWKTVLKLSELSKIN